MAANQEAIELLIPLERQFKALETFVSENEELEQLESLLDQFNIFEAVGMTRQEIRHSQFLAFLLDPQQKHGLGDAFIKQLLRKVLHAAERTDLPISLIDVDVWSFSQATVQREWQNIDILLVDATNQIVVIIENKVDSTEHSNQLNRYWEIVSRHYPDWKTIGIYLTVEGELPSSEKYLPLDYRVVSEVVENFANRRASTLGGDVRTIMLHYVQMLRRHIVNDSEIDDLCQRIYQRHKLALDLIFERRPDQLSNTRDLLLKLITDELSLVIDRKGKSVINFLPHEWDNVPAFKAGGGWTQSGRMLLFEFSNTPKILRLILYIGPGPDETRKRLLETAIDTKLPFNPRSQGLRSKWNSIYTSVFLTEKDYEEDASVEDREKKIVSQWQKFLLNDLPKIKAAIQSQNFQ